MERDYWVSLDRPHTSACTSSILPGVSRAKPVPRAVESLICAGFQVLLVTGMYRIWCVLSADDDARKALLQYEVGLNQTIDSEDEQTFWPMLKNGNCVEGHNASLNTIDRMPAPS